MMEPKDYPKKPPLGVMPNHIWRDTYPSPSVMDYFARYIQLTEATERYAADNKPCPPAWASEKRRIASLVAYSLAASGERKQEYLKEPGQ